MRLFSFSTSPQPRSQGGRPKGAWPPLLRDWSLKLLNHETQFRDLMLSLQRSSFAREKKKVVETRSNFFWARFSKFPELFVFFGGFVFFLFFIIIINVPPIRTTKFP